MEEAFRFFEEIKVGEEFESWRFMVCREGNVVGEVIIFYDKF